MIKVDFLIGNPPTNKTGIGKSTNQNIKYLRKLVDLKLIYSQLLDSKGIKYVTRLSWLVILVSLKKRKNSIIHIGSQENAHILYFYKYNKTVVTCHDIFPFINSDNFHTKFIWNLIIKGMKKANKIIAISEYTKNELVNYCQINPVLIDVIPHGIDFKLYKPINKSNLKNFSNKYSFDLSKKYILYIGSCVKRKNVPMLIKAFAAIKKNKGFVDIKLIMITFPSKEILDLISKFNLNSEILLFNNINEEDIPFFYNIASLFVFLSQYEGFGLPPLEAMACGCPVITSNTTSMPEVVGDAGILVNPNNINEIVKAIKKVLNNKNLMQSLSMKGLKQSKRFSWDINAKKTLSIYNLLSE